ncbi:hypothetical protein HK104_002057, partial [Borealophlyctis nickersoniae]
MHPSSHAVAQTYPQFPPQMLQQQGQEAQLSYLPPSQPVASDPTAQLYAAPASPGLCAHQYPPPEDIRLSYLPTPQSDMQAPSSVGSPPASPSRYGHQIQAPQYPDPYQQQQFATGSPAPPEVVPPAAAPVPATPKNHLQMTFGKG